MRYELNFRLVGEFDWVVPITIIVDAAAVVATAAAAPVMILLAHSHR